MGSDIVRWPRDCFHDRYLRRAEKRATTLTLTPKFRVAARKTRANDMKHQPHAEQTSIVPEKHEATLGRGQNREEDKDEGEVAMGAWRERKKERESDADVLIHAIASTTQHGDQDDGRPNHDEVGL